MGKPTIEEAATLLSFSEQIFNKLKNNLRTEFLDT